VHKGQYLTPSRLQASAKAAWLSGSLPLSGGDTNSCISIDAASQEEVTNPWWLYENWCKIKGPDNPTSQLHPIIRNWLKRQGERRKDKGDGGESLILRVVCEELCVTKLCVKELCVWKVVSDRVVCVRVKGCERKSCVWKIVCDKDVCEIFCFLRSVVRQIAI
jgi:hypothetical protein